MAGPPAITSFLTWQAPPHLFPNMAGPLTSFLIWQALISSAKNRMCDADAYAHMPPLDAAHARLSAQQQAELLKVPLTLTQP